MCQEKVMKFQVSSLVATLQVQYDMMSLCVFIFGIILCL